MKNLEKYTNEYLGGEVTSNKLFVGKLMEIDEDGLLSQKIFGPIHNYRCACGKLNTKIINDGETCPKCKVICGPSELRLVTFGKITTILPFIKPNKLKYVRKLISPKFKYLLDPIRVDANVAMKHYLAYNTTNPMEIKIIQDELKPPSSDFKVIPLRITGIYSLILALKYLVRYEQNDYLEILFNKNVITNVLKVLPPDVRPVLVDKNKPTKLLMHDINKDYVSMINLNRSNLSLKSNIEIDEMDFLSKIHVNLKNNLNEEIIEHVILEYDVLASKIQYYAEKIYQDVYATISGKKGFIRSSVLSRTIEFSARSVIKVDPSLPCHTVKVPKKILYKLWHPYFLNYLIKIKQFDPFDFVYQNVVIRDYDSVKELFNEFLDWFLTDGNGGELTDGG